MRDPACLYRGPKDHINIGISHSCSRAQCKGDTRNHGWYDPSVYVAFWGPVEGGLEGLPTKIWGVEGLYMSMGLGAPAGVPPRCQFSGLRLYSPVLRGEQQDAHRNAVGSIRSCLFGPKGRHTSEHLLAASSQVSSCLGNLPKSCDEERLPLKWRP